MIYLKQGQNKVTISADQILSFPPYYTWEFVRKGTFEQVITYAPSFSPAPWYWNSFTFSVVTYDVPNLIDAGTNQILGDNSGITRVNLYDAGTDVVLGTNSVYPVNFIDAGTDIVWGKLAGAINLIPGEWTYRVFEMATASDINLANALAMVETGIAIVEGEYAENKYNIGTLPNTVTYYKNM